MQKEQPYHILQEQDICKIWNKYKSEVGATYLQMLQSGSITCGDKTMKFKYFPRGSNPDKGYALVFGLHGGGGCPS